jgi:hypothetical protein
MRAVDVHGLLRYTNMFVSPASRITHLTWFLRWTRANNLRVCYDERIRVVHGA